MAERILQLLPADATAAQAADACRGQARADLAALRPKRALALLDAAGAMVAATLAVGDANALGSCYRRRGDIERALEILHQGLHAQQATDVLSAASLHLNLHAALSKLGQHGDALDQASAALIILQVSRHARPSRPAGGACQRWGAARSGLHRWPRKRAAIFSS